MALDLKIRKCTITGKECLKQLNATARPLVIHAELFQGSQPIINARVRAIIERPKVNNTFSFIELELLDNGSGAPDATKNDGVYTRYFTNFVTPVAKFGFYSLTVFADDNDGRAQVVSDDKHWSAARSGIMPKDPNTPFCCGSEAPALLAEPTGPFQRFATAPAFLVTESPKPGIDMFPPSTIRDLKVDNVNVLTGYITLSWTAPGEDYDSGTVSILELHYSHDYKQIAVDFDMTAPVLEPIYPVEAGRRQTLSFYVPDGRNQVYFFAIRAVDHSGLKSEVSNVVNCFVPPEPTTTTEPPTISPSTSSTSPSPVARPLLTAELIGIIVGCTVAFLLIVAIIVVLICANRRRRKLQEEKKTHHTISQVHGPDVVRPPSTISGKEAEWISGLPAESGQETTTTTTQVESAIEGVDGGYFANSTLSPRQFVPASELLQHHEKHRSQAFNTVPPHLNGNGNIQYYYADETDSINKIQQYPPYHPMEMVVDRASISSKPSSYGSQQTAEVTSSSGYGTHIKDNGYINTSYEDGSENSAETARLRPPDANLYKPLVSAPKRVLSESQV